MLENTLNSVHLSSKESSLLCSHFQTKFKPWKKELPDETEQPACSFNGNGTNNNNLIC